MLILFKSKCCINNWIALKQVAKAFWMAIGGDQDEIDGLSSGEEI